MTKFPRGIALLGSTGSIGQQTLDVVRCFPEYFRIVALAARSNVSLLARQAHEFTPKLTACFAETPEVAQAAREALPGVVLGEEGLLAVATHPDVDIVVAATSGLMGLAPTLAAIQTGKTIALANKETLVMAAQPGMGGEPGTRVSHPPVGCTNMASSASLIGGTDTQGQLYLLTS